MDRPVVSVIIPAYNVSEYVEKAVDSICSQSLTDWEMLLIDDGSTDGTGDICDSLAFSDSRIRVIHQENQGAPAARNTGIEKSNGKYLYFMDADDWAAPEMLYEMVCLAEHYYLDAWAGVPVDNRGRDLSSIGKMVRKPSQFLADEPEERCAQLVIAGFYIETYSEDKEYYIQKQSVRPTVFSDKTEFRTKAHELFDRNLLYTPWNKLYLASYIKENGIRFVNRHWDDFPFNLDVIRNIERVCVTDNAYYHFIRQRKNSESEKYNLALFTEREEENTWLLDLYETWRSQETEKVLNRLKEAPGYSEFLEEPDAPELLTGTVGFITVASENDIVQKTQGDVQDAALEKNMASEKKAASEKNVIPETLSGKGGSSHGKDLVDAEFVAVEKGPDFFEENPEDSKTPIKTDVGSGELSSEETSASDKTDEGSGVLSSADTAASDKTGDGSDEILSADSAASDKTDLLPRNISINFPPAEAKEFIARRYIERIVGCVENIANPESGLTRREKMDQIKTMIQKDSVREALKNAKPRSLHMKAMLLPVKMKSATLTYLEGTLISKVKSGNVTLFARLKNNR